nr:immunoglobulin light chain junction region [Macaca mulatta]MOV94351.1 immunoglobulin light chain junction region [Macaca mulatta]MOV94354.1 immunoglobulin light chain junction region [Macaca mulatta]MOV94380.1 immunoglobulin light chain junction region [Macaca mulatta]MOV94383.1 immunoglobulin light chain junction region [Macaca mulatta]
DYFCATWDNSLSSVLF